MTHTTCPYCGVGCGVTVQPSGDGWAVQGDATHPANLGRLCVKGAALGETLRDDGRLLQPTLRADGTPRTVSWDTALDHVADGFRRIIDTHGPDAVAFYVSGQLLTEDYYVANKLMKGFIGSANIDTNSRLCMSSAVAGHKRAFGEDWVPVSYEDVEQADLVILTGSNLAWCHPVLYQRLAAAKAARPALRVVVIDPRRTATCDLADLHLPIRPDADVRLWNRLLVHLAEVAAGDATFRDTQASGVDAALAAAQAEGGDRAQVAAECGLQPETLEQFERWFADTDKVVTVFSQGVNQSVSGTDKVNAIVNAHLYTGRIGRPGMGPLSITGQPNAMGGREVGGLANQLAAHLELDNPQHRDLVQRHWHSPRIADTPGHKAVDLFDALFDGRVKAVWIMATNPVVSLPDADRVRAALARAELVVVSEAMAETDTAACADVLLPATTWGEREGTVTNSERRISRQRAFRTPPGEAQPDWWILSRFAEKMGWGAGFGYTHPAEIFDEYARLTGAGNTAGEAPRLLDLSGLAGLTRADYDALQPVRWPVRAAPVSGDDPPIHYRLVPTPPRDYPHRPDAAHPLVLNTGRVRDQWHTMTRTGLAPTLAAHRDQPTVDLHLEDTLVAGVRVGELARVRTRWGALVARVTSSGEMRRGECFVPIHWNDRTASDARVGALVAPVVDPVSGEPAFKQTPAAVEPFSIRWQGFVMSRTRPALDGVDWWAQVQGIGHQRYECAGRRVPDDWGAELRRWLDVPEGADWIEAADPEAGVYRAAWLSDDRLQACVYLSPRTDLPPRPWLSGLFDDRPLTAAERTALLAGEPLRGSDAGPTVCACFGVGRNTLVKAIQGGCHTPKAVTSRLKAGGNCGSCLPEIRALIADLRPVVA